MADPLPALTVLIVSYRRADQLARALDSVLRHLPGTQVRVWDNASDGSDEVRRLAAIRPEVQWTFSPTNVGFGVAVNHLMRAVTDPVVLLLNPDAELDGPMVGCRALMAEQNSVAACAPWLTQEATTRPWDNAHREPTLIRQVWSYAGWSDSSRRSTALSDLYDQQPSEVSGYLTGACLWLRMAAWRDVGPFDERFFLYCEEADWARRARQRGWTLRAVPEPGARHDAGGTVQDDAEGARRSAGFLARSQSVYLRMHAGVAAMVCYRVATAVLDRVQRSKRRPVGSESRGSTDWQPHVLVVSAMLPTDSDPVRGIVVRREIDELRRHGVVVTEIGKAPGVKGYVRQASELVAVLRRGGVDLVHAHYGTTGFLVAACALRTPVVVTMHGADITYGPRPNLSKYWLQYLMSVAGAVRAARVLVQDDTMLAPLPASIRRKTEVWGQAIKVTRTEPSRGSASDDPAVDGGALMGRGEERSGVLFLSDRARPDKNFGLAEQAVRALTGDTKVLRSLDEFGPDGVLEAMRRARVGLLTSTREGMPVAVKEALACGLTVVATDLPPLRPVAQALPFAVLLSDGTSRAMASAIGRALAQPPIDSRQQAVVDSYLHARDWVEPAHTLRLIAMYRQVVSSRRRGQ